MKPVILRLGAVSALVLGLAACQPAYQGGYQTGAQQSRISPDMQRAAGGAVAGALIAKVLDEDVVTGAAVGATAGVFCDDLGVCQKRNAPVRYRY